MNLIEKDELIILNSLKNTLPSEVIDSDVAEVSVSSTKQLDRKNLRMASKLPDDAGWEVGDDGLIEDARFKTFGCGSAIASSSLATEWLKGKTIDQADEIQNTQIVEELNLPPVKIHCSVLAEDAIKTAIADFKSKQEV